MWAGIEHGGEPGVAVSGEEPDPWTISARPPPAVEGPYPPLRWKTLTRGILQPAILARKTSPSPLRETMPAVAPTNAAQPEPIVSGVDPGTMTSV
jgi:hypothetical protein